MTRIAEVADRIIRLLKEQPRRFYAILQALEDVEYRTILQAWGTLRERDLLARDDHGRYLLRTEGQDKQRGAR